jgi:hypothetical protein
MTIHFANLFAENTDLSVGLPNWNRRFKSNTFDAYSQEGNEIEVRHRVDRNTKCDVFSVQVMVYEYKGCLVGNQINFGEFNTFAEAVACAECSQLPEGSISEDSAIALR